MNRIGYNVILGYGNLRLQHDKTADPVLHRTQNPILSILKSFLSWFKTNSLLPKNKISLQKKAPNRRQTLMSNV